MNSGRIRFFLMMAVSGLLLIACSDDKKNPVDNGNNQFSPRGMVLINARDASFQMGSETGSIDEVPVHTVRFTRNFWMDTTEVTQGDYDVLMRDCYPDYTTPSWHEPYGVGARNPAYEVYWGDAVLYCNARSRRDGLDSVYTYSAIRGIPGNLCELDSVRADFSKSGYRLPTEAEWEFACRGGSNADFPWGKQCDPYPATPEDTLEFNSYAVWFANSWDFSSDSPEFGPHIVGTKRPNAYGLYDMVGNLYEWCHDWYGDYPAGSVVDPTGPDDGPWHAVRGGSWGSHAFFLRSASRTFSVPDYLYYFIGFRVVLPVE